MVYERRLDAKKGEEEEVRIQHVRTGLFLPYIRIQVAQA